MHLDNIGGIPALIDTIFGKIYAPNHVLPRWLLEGLAVHEESRHTSAGRIRSTMFDMYMRMDALAGHMVRLDQLSNEVDRWPHGDVWYLYGSRVVQYIVDRWGEQALAAFAREYGSQAIPYGLNRIARRVTGETFVQIYDEWQREVTRHYREVAHRIGASDPIEGTRLTFHGETALSPRWIDDDHLVYYVYDGRHEGQIREIEARPGGDGREVVRAIGNTYVSVHPDGRSLYYNGLDQLRDVYFLDDLFRVDLRTGERERLTRGLRAEAPDVSPSGRHIVFTINGAGTRHLMIADTRDIEGTKRVLVRSRRFEQVYTPRFSPDGRKVAYSVWMRGGHRDIRILDLDTHQGKNVTWDRAIDTGPAWSPDGRRLYFSSDRTGIANIYAFDVASGRTEQVTNVLGGAFQPAVSPDGKHLVYVGYTARGFDLWTLRLDPSRFRPAAPYVDDRPLPSEASDIATVESEPYDPLGTLAPRGYLLNVGSDPFGGTEVGLTFTGSDAVGYHTITGRLGVSTSRGDIDADLAYTYSRLATPITLHVFRAVSPRGGLVVGGEPRTWVEDSRGVDLSLSYPFPTAFHSESVRIGYSLSDMVKAEPFGGRLDPNTPPPKLPQLGLVASLHAGWSWSDVQRQSFDISPSSGTSLNLDVSMAHPALGSQYRAVTVTWSLRHFFAIPWLPYHVLALRYAGGLSGGDLGRRGLFSVGGFPDVAIPDALLNNVILGGAALRGYAPFFHSGTQYHLLQAEYRFPIFRPEVGLGTVPLYVDRLYGTLFADWGDAFFGHLDLGSFRLGLGGELLLDFTVGYYLPFTLRVGLARGVSQDGLTQLYANIGVPF